MKNKSFTPIAEKNIKVVLDTLKFSDQGLIPAIAQQENTGEILMMAWMNADSIQETLTTGHVCYWSRSRKALWRKGETSGQIQRLVHFRYDCDKDTILLIVDQMGVACHTGRRNCFFNEVTKDGIKIIKDVEIAADTLYSKLKI
ncbi:MAG: phosphoribosyl-AMP cyclohydrolase [Emcibacter sp.]|nr:phosphoribosyl-AMP cyclohydrolase [Emcibacter sp.]